MPVSGKPAPVSGWTKAWLVWAVLFLMIEIPAAIFTPDAVGTLSVHVWGEWFSEPWARGVFLVFWAVVGVHFANRGRRWYSSGKAVAVTGTLVALVILWKEKESMGWLKKVAGAIWKGGGKAVGWVLRRGPIISSALTGLALAFPQFAGVLKWAAALLAGASGGSVDQEAVEATGVVVNAAILLIGAVRKVWSIYKKAAAARE